MSFRYKMNVLTALKEAGYNTNKLRKEKILAEGTIQRFRKDEMVAWATLDWVCTVLKCQPGDLIEHVEENPEE